MTRRTIAGTEAFEAVRTPSYVTGVRPLRGLSFRGYVLIGAAAFFLGFWGALALWVADLLQKGS